VPTRIISVQVCALHRAHAPALEWQPRLRVCGFEIRSLQETLASRPSSGLLSLPHLAAPQERMSAKGSHSRAASAVPLIRGHMADMRQHATVSEQLREVRRARVLRRQVLGSSPRVWEPERNWDFHVATRATLWGGCAYAEQRS